MNRIRYVTTIVFACALGAGFVGGMGCSTIPAPVVSPGVRSSIGVAGTYSSDYGFARAHPAARRNDTDLSVNGDDSFGSRDPERAVLGSIIPAALSMHEVAGEWVGGEYLGWWRFGLTVRRRLRVTPSGAMTSLTAAGNSQFSRRRSTGRWPSSRRFRSDPRPC